jgi:hypothetical protein
VYSWSDGPRIERSIWRVIRALTTRPIRIRRGAFADDLLHRDSPLSPDHAVFVDGTLIA